MVADFEDLENPSVENKDVPLPLLEHLSELMQRFKRSVIYIVVGFGIGYAVSEKALMMIMKPIKQFLPPGVKLVYTQPFELVFVLMKTALVIGVVLAVPAIFMEFFFFLNPALKVKQGRRIWSTFVGAWIIALLGVVWSYYYLLPAILDIVLSYQSLDLSPVISLSYYVNASLGLLLVGAIFFEIPFFMTMSSAWGLLPASFWSKNRRYAIVINSIVAAILSPPDVTSMLAMMIPVQVLYEIGHLVARVFEKRSVQSQNIEV